MTAPLIYIVGPSGSGKDSVMGYCRERLAGADTVQFAHRYITRAADAGGENHIQLSAPEFAARAVAGLFALHWDSHGHRYGIGIEIDAWLARGVATVVNGSREHLPQARLRYANLLPVWIAVAPDVLRGRLVARGRESAAAIEERLARLRAGACPRQGDAVVHNDGALEDAGNALLAVIEGALACA